MKTVPLRRVASFSYGEALAAEIREDGTVPVMSSGGVSGSHTTANTSGPVIVVGRKGSHGAVWWSDQPAFVIDTAYSIDRTNTEADLKWLYYALLTLQLKAVSSDVGVPGLSREKAYELPIPLTSVEEQRRIADFLDDQVHRIDQIIAARQQQGVLVQGLGWRAFEERVESRAMAPLRRMIASISDGPFGSAFSSSDYSLDGPVLVRLGNIGFDEFKSDDLAHVPVSIHASFPRSHIRPGDLVIASLGDARNHAGRACVMPSGLGAALAKGKTFVAQANRSTATERFLAILLSSPTGARALSSEGTGATRNMLNFERLLGTPVPLLPLAEQEAAICAHDRCMESAQRSAAAIQSSVTLLQEYKQSLITAAVTGEFDVTTASTKLPE